MSRLLHIFQRTNHSELRDSFHAASNRWIAQLHNYVRYDKYVRHALLACDQLAENFSEKDKRAYEAAGY